MLSTDAESRQVVSMGWSLGGRYVQGCGVCNSSSNSIQLDPFGHNQTKAPTFLARHLYTHRTCVQAPASTCTIPPSIPKHWRRSSCFPPIGCRQAAARRRSTHPSPLAHPPHFANSTPAQATSENRCVKELDRSCSASLLFSTRGGRGCWMALCDVMGGMVIRAVVPCTPLRTYKPKRSHSVL